MQSILLQDLGSSVMLNSAGW